MTLPALEGTAWQNGALVVSDPEKVEKIRRKNLSASVAHKVAQCPASMAAETLLPRTSDPFGPREIGGGSHAALEGLYSQPALERTPDFIPHEVLRLADIEWSEDKLEDKGSQSIQANNELKVKWIDTITKAALADFDIETPSEIDVVKTEWKIRDVKIAAGVPFVGFIDRTDRLGCAADGDILALRDYKFGKWKVPNSRFPQDDYGDQLRLYKAAVEVETGRAPAEAALLYPIAGKTRQIDLSEGAVKQTLFAFDLSWQAMNRAADEQKFTAQPSALCAWCPLANSCPVAQVVSEKAIAHAKTQPSAEDLGIPTILTAQPSGNRPADPIEPQPTAPSQPEQAPRIGMGKTRKTTRKATTMTIPDLAKQYPVSEYAAIAVFSLVDTATAHLDSQAQPLNPSSISAFSNVLAGILTTTVRSLFGNSGWEHGKLARVEHSLKMALEIRPAPFGQNADAWQEWTKAITGLVTAKAQVALGLLSVDEFDANAFTHFVPTAVTAA